jgi:predicted GNAT family N-acyltransferase
MTEQVREFLLTMLNMGLERGQANAKTYDYAIALLLEKEARGNQVTATMMTQAHELVREAWESQPLKYYLQEIILQERAMERAKR